VRQRWTQFVVDVEVAVVRDDGAFLLIRRGPGEAHAAGTWAFPGGALDVELKPDVLESAVRRELFEETGLSVTQLEYVESHCFMIAEDTPVLVVLFIAPFAGGDTVISDSDEVAAVAWRTAAEVIADATSEPWIVDMMRRAEARRLSLVW
jgi:8-oxo-dGTP diphosphatase